MLCARSVIYLTHRSDSQLKSIDLSEAFVPFVCLSCWLRWSLRLQYLFHTLLYSTRSRRYSRGQISFFLDYLLVPPDEAHPLPGALIDRHFYPLIIQHARINNAFIVFSSVIHVRQFDISQLDFLHVSAG